MSPDVLRHHGYPEVEIDPIEEICHISPLVETQTLREHLSYENMFSGRVILTASLHHRPGRTGSFSPRQVLLYCVVPSHMTEKSLADAQEGITCYFNNLYKHEKEKRLDMPSPV